MEYRYLGNSGLRVSQLSLGSWLTIGEQPLSTTREIIDVAISGGINHFDTADGYARGEAERQLGNMLANYERSQLVLSSKVFWPTSDAPNDGGLGRKHLTNNIERSLSNLATDYLDVYYCHREDPNTPIEETVTTMDNLIRQGKILYWGTSMWKLSTLKKAVKFAHRHGLNPPIVEQLPYSLLERWPEKCAQRYQRLGVGIASWSPLAGGVLTGKYLEQTPRDSRGARTDWVKDYLKPDIRQKIQQFCTIASALDIKPSQLALAWVLRSPFINTVITGASNKEQLLENLQAQNITLPIDVSQQLSKLFSR